MCIARIPATLALALVLGRCLAATAVYGPLEVEVPDRFGSTFAEAQAQREETERSCALAGRSCGKRAMEPRELMPVSRGCGSTYVVAGWWRAAEVDGAERYIAELRRRAAARELFDCIGTTCLALVRTWPRDGRETDRSVSTLSVCQVHLVPSATLPVPGPPTVCREALKSHSQHGILLRVIIGQSATMCSMGMRDFDAVFKGRAGDVAAVRQIVGEVLRGKPFNLTVMEEGTSLIGSRAHVSSELLSGWREWTTVRVEVDVRGGDAGTIISTTLLVSKQASISREAWTPASEPQEAAYLTALRKAFERRGGSLRSGFGR